MDMTIIVRIKTWGDIMDLQFIGKLSRIALDDLRVEQRPSINFVTIFNRTFKITNLYPEILNSKFWSSNEETAKLLPDLAKLTTVGFSGIGAPLQKMVGMNSKADAQIAWSPELWFLLVLFIVFFQSDLHGRWELLFLALHFQDLWKSWTSLSNSALRQALYRYSPMISSGLLRTQ